MATSTWYVGSPRTESMPSNLHVCLSRVEDAELDGVFQPLSRARTGRPLRTDRSRSSP